MGRVTRAYSFAAGAIIQATQLNSVYDTIYGEFNGNVDDGNIKENANIDGAKIANSSITNLQLVNGCIADANLDYTSIKVLRVGPNINGNGIRTASGIKAFTYIGGVVSVTVTFSTDSDAGNPQFQAPPRVSVGVQHTGGTDQHSIRLLEVRASGFTFEMRSSNVADASSGSLHWIAEGQA